MPAIIAPLVAVATGLAQSSFLVGIASNLIALGCTSPASYMINEVH